MHSNASPVRPSFWRFWRWRPRYSLRTLLLAALCPASVTISAFFAFSVLSAKLAQTVP